MAGRESRDPRAAVPWQGRNAKVAVLDEDGMVRPSEKVEDGFLLANKTPGLFKKKLYALLVLCCSA